MCTISGKNTESFIERLKAADKVLVGIGAEWQKDKNSEIRRAYDKLARLLEGKDYFIVTTNTDAAIFEHTGAGGVAEATGSAEVARADGAAGFAGAVRSVEAARADGAAESAGAVGSVEAAGTHTREEETAPRQPQLDASRITAPCGNETWRQCSKSCTKDIWEPGEIPDDICPHCGAPLTGNTIHADIYIEEGYLPQWHRYTAWLATTVNKNLLMLELGESFQTPTVIRWPFEKTIKYNQKAFLYRVNGNFAQLPEGVAERAVSVHENSVEWILGAEL